ncbi:MAG: hypothetical protein GX892_07740 [Thermoanaerobacteraceae bacterium]|nr:hypothetical protein [Thermoanaerobacteraceae bacterium]
MIRIGLDDDVKQNIITDYIYKNKIKKVFIFYYKDFPLNYTNDNVAIEHIEYSDIIMYKFFYRLLEEIDNYVLLVFNECLRTQNRSELTYNCAHHYCNQTQHKIIFEYFPFIEDSQDFMILLDFQNKYKYKGKSFKYEFLAEEDIAVEPKQFTIQTIDIKISQNDIEKYEKLKNSLFDNLGESDPDTIPRNLHIWAGNLKKSYIKPEFMYIARNKRFKLPNVITYREAVKHDYIIIDMPHRRIDFNDFLKKTRMCNMVFINSGLKVDLYYVNDLKEWVERLGEFYDKASIYQQKCA